MSQIVLQHETQVALDKIAASLARIADALVMQASLNTPMTPADIAWVRAQRGRVAP